MTLAKTEAGQRVLKDRSVALTPRQRAAFILIDGRRSAEDVLAAAGGVTREDIDKLVELGLVHEVAGTPAPLPPPGSAPVPRSAPLDPGVSLATQRLQPRSDRTPQQRYADAYPIATKLTAGLGLRGFRLNLAVEAAGNFMDLLALAPRIREAVGDAKFAELDRALND